MLRLALWAVVVLLLQQSAALQALPEDRLQPIRISADKAVRDERRGLTIYSGNVRMEQGTLEIEADTITIYRIQEEGDKIVAQGQPARLQQQPEPGEELVRARANTIEYFKLEDRVQLREQATIEQDGSTIRSESIDYLIVDQVVRANSAASSEENRVEVFLPARAVQDAQTRDDDTTGPITGEQPAANTDGPAAGEPAPATASPSAATPSATPE